MFYLLLFLAILVGLYLFSDYLYVERIKRRGSWKQYPSDTRNPKDVRDAYKGVSTYHAPDLGAVDIGAGGETW